MDDVNAVHTLEFAHRRQLLVVRALNERSCLIRQTYIPIHAHRSSARRCLVRHPIRIPAHAGKPGSTPRGRALGRTAWTTLGFPLARRVSLMLISMLVAAMGVNRKLLQTPSRRRGFPPWPSAEKYSASLDVSYTASHRIAATQDDARENGALIDELVPVTRLAPLLETNLRTEPSDKFYATDAFSEWRWRLRCAHHTRGLARLVRVGRGQRRARAP